MEASLKVAQGPRSGTVFSLSEGETKTVGRGPGADCVLADPKLQPRHVAVMIGGGAFRVVDLGGGSGTLLNGQPLPVREPTEAWSGDTIALGDCVLRVTVQGRSSRGVDSRGGGGALSGAAVLPADEFEQVREIGKGAMGTVYAALWKPDQRWVAVKVLHETVAPDSPDFQRFFRECETMARVNSPYVVAVFDVRNTGGRAYAIQELVEGPSARDLLARGGPLPIPAALRLGEDVAQALVAAASVGVVHRDVKPANVVLSPQRVAKLCDFGIAKDMQGTLRSLTASGVGLGTMAYLPPEQVSHAKHVDARADVYSLGASLYHLLAGQPPFKPTSAEALLHIVTQEPPALHTLRPDCPPEVAQVVSGLMAKDVGRRPPAFRALRTLQSARARLYPGYAGEGLF